jgi:hypothetical protein
MYNKSKPPQVPELTYGFDPEFFAVDKNNFVISPAIMELEMGLTPVARKKDLKHPVYINNKDFSWMMDGVAFELTSYVIFNEPKQMQDLVKNALMELGNLLGKYNLSIFTKPVVDFDLKWMKYSDNEKVSQGLIFGCDRDYDAIISNYTCDTINISTHNKRYGGGHLHLGIPEEWKNKVHRELFNPFIRLLAITCGNINIATSKYPELEVERAQYYGKPGRYRLQKHGIEYRTPSNSWTTNNDAIELMFNGGKLAFELLKNSTLGRKVIEEYLESTIYAITTGNQELSSNILKGVNL